jgi:hypothetical protein
VKDQTWPEKYTEYKITYDRTVNPPRVVGPTSAENTDTWVVKETNATVMVAAGTFNNCMVLEKRTQIARFGTVRGAGAAAGPEVTAA